MILLELYIFYILYDAFLVSKTQPIDTFWSFMFLAAFIMIMFTNLFFVRDVIELTEIIDKHFYNKKREISIQKESEELIEWLEAKAIKYKSSGSIHGFVKSLGYDDSFAEMIHYLPDIDIVAHKRTNYIIIQKDFYCKIFKNVDDAVSWIQDLEWNDDISVHTIV